MIYLFLLAVLTVVMLVIYGNSRQTHGKRHWTDQTSSECFTLLIMLAAAVQFLFVTMIPGWIFAAITIGKGKFAQTSLGNEIFGIVMMLANTIFYLLIFYWLFGRLRAWHRRQLGGNDLDLTSINVAQSSSKEKEGHDV